MLRRFHDERSKTRSYQDRVSSTNKRNKYIIFFLAVFLTYQLVSTFFIRSYRIGNAGMEPNFSANSRVLASPLFYGPVLWGGHRLPSGSNIARGDVVLTQTPGAGKRSFIKEIFNPFLRFFSLNFLSFKNRNEKIGLPEIVLKRVIALPGDTVKMENNVIYVRPSGESYFLNEFEISHQSYETLRPESIEHWDNLLPLAPYFNEITLKNNEYMIVGDNRSLINDSRTFGPVRAEDIRAKVLFTYWPLSIKK
jgi:signal peptidase I